MISNELIMNEKIVLRMWLIVVVWAFLPVLSDDSIADLQFVDILVEFD